MFWESVLLVHHLLTLFQDSSLSKQGAQLFGTSYIEGSWHTHSVALVLCSIISAQQVWPVQKRTGLLMEPPPLLQGTSQRSTVCFVLGLQSWRSNDFMEHGYFATSPRHSLDKDYLEHAQQ